jgi:anti-sigma B factor antagonist
MPDVFFTQSASGQVQIIALDLPQVMDTTHFDRINTDLESAVRARPGAGWVLDLEKVQYTGSAMLGVIVNFRQVVKQSSGRLALCGMSPRLMEVFRTCSLDRLFKTVATTEQAMKAVT